VECYARGAAQLKLEKRWEDAARLYERIVAVCQQHENLTDRQLEFQRDAAKCFQSGGVTADACRLLEAMAKREQEQGRLSTAGREWREIAMLHQRARRFRRENNEQSA